MGLAAGMDKDAQFPSAIEAFGFGHVEVGTVTPEPQLEILALDCLENLIIVV